VDVEWIDTTEGLAGAVREAGPGPVAVDLEADSFHHFREKVCLVQLAFSGRNLLVDPLAGVSLEPLRPMLRDAGTRKVMHGADYDLRLLGRDHGLAVSGVFDTMIAARLTGERAFGLAALLQKHLGVELDKSHQRADWSRRPLPEAMAAYAVEDTRHLAALAERLEARLSELGRTAWAEEEFRRLEGVRWAEAPEPEPWRRIKGAAGLDRRQLAVLREVAAVREEIARARDLPLFRVLRDEAAVELARRKPRERQALAEVPGIPRPFLSGEPSRALLGAIARALDLDGDLLPEIRRGERARVSPELEQAVRRLRDERDRLASELDLDPSLLAPRGALHAVAARTLAGEPIAGSPELRAWQAALLLPVWGAP
jgi:ribonuclease D